MTDWTYHTPAKDGDAHPDWREGMERECRLPRYGTWLPVESEKTYWLPHYTYRFRSTEPAQETVDPSIQSAKAMLDMVLLENWAVNSQVDIVRRLQGVQKHLARYIAAHEPAPVDPLREAVGKALEASFSKLGPCVLDFAEITEQLRARGVCGPDANHGQIGPNEGE